MWSKYFLKYIYLETVSDTFVRQVGQVKCEMYNVEINLFYEGARFPIRAESQNC